MKPKVVIVGAGFSGLVAAWRLEREGFQVTILERSERVGGLLRTQGHELGIMETAANGLLASALVEELFKDCGIELQTTLRSARRRFLLVSEKVERWPLTFFETLGAFFRLLIIKARRPKEKETLLAWAERALGRAMANKVIDVAVLGVFAATASKLSATLVVGRFFDATRLRLKKGRRRGTVTAPEGMGQLIDALASRLKHKGVSFELSANDIAARLAVLKRQRVPVVLAVPAWVAAEIIKDFSDLLTVDPGDLKPPSEHLLRQQRTLSRIQAIPVVSATLFFAKPPPRRGFGTLFSQSPPYGEDDGILGCLQNSEIFSGRVAESAAAGTHSETWILGGSNQGENLLKMSDIELSQRILAKRAKYLDSESGEKCLDCVVTRWPRAIPLYDVVIERRRSLLLEPQDGVVLFGNYLGEIGLASILESTKLLPMRIDRARARF